MKEDVSLELAEEEERERARIGFADGAGADRAREVVREDADDPARRDLLVLRIERHDDRGRVHLYGDRGTDDAAEERDHPARELAQDDARIRGSVEAGDGRDEVGGHDAPVAHRRGEELLLRGEVAQDRRGRDAEGARDVGERRRGEPAGTERAAGGLEDLIGGDARRASHGVCKRRFTNSVCQWPFTNS